MAFKLDFGVSGVLMSRILAYTAQILSRILKITAHVRLLKTLPLPDPLLIALGNPAQH
jgi:hypothetical protein